jgi:hypothetical protein
MEEQEERNQVATPRTFGGLRKQPWRVSRIRARSDNGLDYNVAAFGKKWPALDVVAPRASNSWIKTRFHLGGRGCVPRGWRVGSRVDEWSRARISADSGLIVN